MRQPLYRIGDTVLYKKPLPYDQMNARERIGTTICQAQVVEAEYHDTGWHYKIRYGDGTWDYAWQAENRLNPIGGRK